MRRISNPVRILSSLRPHYSPAKLLFTPLRTVSSKPNGSAEMDKLQVKEWNNGVFSASLRDEGIAPRPFTITRNLPGGLIQAPDSAPPSLSVGTFQGTKSAVTDIYHRILERFGSYFDVANFESSLPQNLSLSTKQDLYTWSNPTADNYPPHLQLIPDKDRVGLLNIFDAMRLLDTGSVLARVIPESFLDSINGKPDDGSSIAALEARNHQLRQDKKDLFAEPNIGDRADWYSDAIFAQQQLTGSNPVTITQASRDWVDQFKNAASVQGNTALVNLLNSADGQSLFVQDCSYFRSAIGVDPQAPLASEDPLPDRRYGCAAVSLFQLHPDGKLHPLAIVIDYKQTMASSVVIFNRRLLPTDSTASEATDWPWRYAKTAAQVSDWTHHELTTHLVDTHFVEEAVIVATHRAYDPTHPVFRLLEPHWYKTLSLNAAARATLVPSVVVPLSGMATDQVYSFIKDAYARFDWVKNYVPNDLARRGFEPSQLTDKKFHNYAYGRDVYLLWQTLRSFVSTVLRLTYKTDADVAMDASVSAWCNEMRSPRGGQMSSFPVISTFDGLVDAVVMSIHLASPQHTAVNYLQQYYQAFVAHKPPALFSPLPTSLQQLKSINEAALMSALPANRPRQWLLASHLPYLLSLQVAEEQNLTNYAVSLAKVSKLSGEKELEAAALKLWTDLTELKTVFKNNSDQMDKGSIPYMVLDPDVTATSILI